MCSSKQRPHVIAPMRVPNRCECGGACPGLLMIPRHSCRKLGCSRTVTAAPRRSGTMRPPLCFVKQEHTTYCGPLLGQSQDVAKTHDKCWVRRRLLCDPCVRSL